jgi:hypothetical protein
MPNSSGGGFARALFILLGLLAFAVFYLFATDCGGILEGTILDIWSHTC